METPADDTNPATKKIHMRNNGNNLPYSLPKVTSIVSLIPQTHGSLNRISNLVFDFVPIKILSSSLWDIQETNFMLCAF